MNKLQIKQMIFDYMYGHDMNSVDEKDQIQFEDYFEEWWENYMSKFHGVDYTNNQYITMKTHLEEGTHTFQVKVEDQGLVLDVFLHIGDDDEHIITKAVWYEDIGLIREEKSNE